MISATANKNYLQTLVRKFPDAAINRIMIVDASDDVNLTFKIVLSESDRRLRVESFNDPIDALREFRPSFYHLVIIDILMPKMNGFELYNRLRKLDSNFKICFMTTGSEIFLREFAKEAFPELNLNCFIRKPIANEDLLKRVQEVLELRKEI
jgi:two-component system, OmpR family, response regulator ChvI